MPHPTAPRDSSPFSVRRSVRQADRLVRHIIYAGGVGVILTVSGLFVFLFLEILPLFQKAHVGPPRTIASGVHDPLLVGISPDGKGAFILSQKGTLHPVSLDPSWNAAATQPLPVPYAPPNAAAWLQERQLLLLGTADGTILKGRPAFNAFSGTGGPSLTINWDPPFRLSHDSRAILQLDMAGTGQIETLAAVTRTPDGDRLDVASRVFATTPFVRESAGPLSQHAIALEPGQTPLNVVVGSAGDLLMTLTREGAILVYRLRQGNWDWIQTFTIESTARRIVTMHPLQGRHSLYVTDDAGGHHIASLVRQEDASLALTRIATFPESGKPLLAFSASPNNKALLIATSDTLHLRYGTTGKTRWEEGTETAYTDIRLHSLYDGFTLLDSDGGLTVFTLDDPHPEAGWKAFFGKLWYEGYEAPAYVWQSTGGSDTHEPKISLIPLLFGSFKGTLFALVFAIPIALSAAVYTARFLHPGLRALIKPTVELMASLPSVVLGFMAALWLGPMLETKVPSLLLATLAIPLSAILAGLLWHKWGSTLRAIIPEGIEFILLAPVIGVATVLAWQSGPLLENALSNLAGPAGQALPGDFRLWWEATTGGQFQQRNALIIGLVMGFAIIPVIYTIAEDALSAVPKSLVSGSLALGADSWQTTFHIVIPTASAGIFSAIIIGTGRAIGETMVLLMASGNTPILEGDLFSGMRTLAANIAIELPEATVDSTLYRTLFLGAMVLFILTFLFNTFAEILRERLRRKYRVIE